MLYYLKYYFYFYLKLETKLEILNKQNEKKR